MRFLLADGAAAAPAATQAANATAQAAEAVQPTASGGGTPSLFAINSVIHKILNVDVAVKAAQVILVSIIGLVIVGLVVTVLKRILGKRMDSRSGMLVVRAVQYLGVGIIVINAFETADINLSALLGAAGIAGIALGFAAQTSISNFISGIFLMSEKTFSVGDVVTVDTITGVVYSIDTLSVKLRTFDNQLVRIPNESLIKSNVVNVTRFPSRRLNVRITVEYGTDIEKAKAILLEAAAANPGLLKKPEPFFQIQGFGKDGIDLFFGVWFAKEDWEPANNGTYLEINKRFEAAGIRFAYPTMTVYPKK